MIFNGKGPAAASFSQNIFLAHLKLISKTTANHRYA